MSYSRKTDPVLYEYNLNNIALTRPEFIKDLGVTFDGKLTFNKHIEQIVQSSYKNLGFVLRNSKGFTDVNVFLLLFNTFVRSKLEYASLIWNPGYIIHIDSLENILRRFLKFMSYIIDGVYPAVGFPQHILLSRFDIESLEARRDKQALLFLFKLIHNVLSYPPLLEKLPFSLPRINSRHVNTFYLATPRTNLLKFSPLYFICNTYNHLQDIIDIFHTNLKTIKNLKL